jgi:integrase
MSLEPSSRITLPTRAKRGKAKARGNGDGARWELPDGRWRWQLTVRVVKGKQQRVGGVSDKTEAKRALAEARTELDRRTLAIPERITVMDYVTRWFDRQKDIEDSTRSNYRTVLDYALEHLGAMPMTAVRTHHVRDVLATLADRKATRGFGAGRVLSSRTLAQVRGRLRAVFREAFTDGLLPSDPTAAVKRVKVVRTEHPGIALDLPEVSRFRSLGEALYDAGKLRLWPALFLALSVGLRRGEVCGLRWGDLDLEVRQIRVRQNYTVLNGKTHLKGYTKTEAGQRNVPMPPSLQAALVRHRARLERELARSGRVVAADTPLFPSGRAEYTHPDNLTCAVRDVHEWSHPEGIVPRKRRHGTKLARKLTVPITLERRLRGVLSEQRTHLRAVVEAGQALPKISTHDLRHTCATLWLRRGVPLEVVSKWLGHADIGTTLKHYRHVLESEKRAHAVDLFSESD